MRATQHLRALLSASEPVIAVGAHDALSAKLVVAAGFEVVWASGFGISTVNAVPDANILTMTEMLEAVKRMLAAVDVPIIADCDSGYGNAINAMRTVREFSRQGVAGICLEDNVFPKRCSFYSSVRRELVPAEEHADKIRAAQSAKVDPDFVVIARTEAFIAGEGLEQALHRARAYAAAGADAILVHSKSRDFEELREFSRHWSGECPLVSVPTTYSGVTLDELAACGFRLAIFANQPLRAAIRSMRETLATLRASGCAAAVEDRIASLPEVYQIVDVPQLQEDERRYLGGAEPLTAVIIAAGFEAELMPLTLDRPKGMLEVHGRSILAQQVDALRQAGVRDIAIVRGHQRYAIDIAGVRYYDNEEFGSTGELYSLLRAREALGGGFVFLYSDILFDDPILHKLLRSPADVALVVDRAFRDRATVNGTKRRPDLVISDGNWDTDYRVVPRAGGFRVRGIGKRLEQRQANGEFAGMAMLSARGASRLLSVYDELSGRPGPFHEAASPSLAGFPDAIQEMIDRGQAVYSVDVYKGWMEVNTFDDYRRAWGLDADTTEPGARAGARR